MEASRAVGDLVSKKKHVLDGWGLPSGEMALWIKNVNIGLLLTLLSSSSSSSLLSVFYCCEAILLIPLGKNETTMTNLSHV